LGKVNNPTQRSHGIGKAILQALEVRAIEAGIQENKVNSRQDACRSTRKTAIRY